MPIPHFSDPAFFRKFHYHGELGALYQPGGTEFRVWAPTATRVWLVTFGYEVGGSKWEQAMSPDTAGTWSITLPGDLHGLYYIYKVEVHGAVNYAVDPYAKAVGVNGELGMVVDLARTNPPGWHDIKNPPLDQFVDAIIYELHVRDLSIDPSSGIHWRGKYLGMTERGTRGPGGVKTGLDHLVELGITHVQLMPCFDFATVDERKNDEYNWGYDPLNYNAPEGSYATDPHKGERRIYEFKQLIQALKEAGIRVNMDVVYNHTFFTHSSHLNRLVPDYYYRQDFRGDFANGSGCGNELASERSMVRKFIVDSVTYWAKEYKIDGFRFDLMGLIDIPTINEIRAALNAIDPSIMVYGEGWTGGPSPLPGYLQSLKGNIRELPGTGAFNDDLRDGLRGHVFQAEHGGFVNGGKGHKESVKLGIVGAGEHHQIHYEQVLYSKGPWTTEPGQSINYAEVHDNLTLWDKLIAVSPHLNEELLAKMHKLCGAVVLTSQGIPFLHGGMEFLRTKQGDANSYRSPDHINRIDWNRKLEYLQVFHYYKGLITLRKYHPGFRMTTNGQVQKHLRFLPVPDENLLVYCLEDNPNGDSWRTIAVIFNGNLDERAVTLPYSNWITVVNGDKAGTTPLDVVEGNLAIVPPVSALVLVESQGYN